MAYTPPFLQNCFVIFDLSLCGDENGVEEAMMNFAKSFTAHPLEIASLDKFKVAFKLIGSIAMILSGTSDQPESTLVNHLNLLYDGFRFYNRSFQVVAENHTSRKELHQKMAEIGRELVPMLSQSFHNTLRTFNPIPYTPLIHKANRHFIQASQLLHFVEVEPGNLSGCVIYKNSVICTHLDFMTTRFVLNRLDFNKSSMYSTLQPLYTSSARGRMEPVCDFIPVYMLRESVEGLISDRDNMFPFSDIQTVSTPTSSSPFPHHQRGGSEMLLPSGHPAMAEEVDEHVDGFMSLGLCIVSVHELSIAILMTYKAFSNKQHIKRSIWKIPADPHFQMLENDLETDSFPFSRSPPLGSAPTSNGPLISSNANSVVSGSGSANSDSNSVPSRSFIQPPLLFNARIVQSSSYNFFTYDPLTESAAVTPLTTPQEYEFAQAISCMHHSFSLDPEVSEIIHKDASGEIYGKQVFGREVYYQLKNGASISHDKFLEVIEKTVRATLKEDHNINMI